MNDQYPMTFVTRDEGPYVWVVPASGVYPIAVDRETGRASVSAFSEGTLVRSPEFHVL